MVATLSRISFINLLIVHQFLIILYGCVPITTTSISRENSLVYDNRNYSPTVGMVKLHPHGNELNARLEEPTLELKDGAAFKLSFDLLEDRHQQLQARFIHCNADWTPSNLSAIRFLDDFNSFDLDHFEYSMNTKAPYINYRTTLLAPKISGNYLIVVSRGGNEYDLVLSRRVQVFEMKTQIAAQAVMSSSLRLRDTHQQLNASIRYFNLHNINPIQDLKVVAIQNGNWNTAIEFKQPSLIRADQHYLEYHPLNGDQNFPGGNEYRFVDLQMVDYRGMNVQNIAKYKDQIVVSVQPDKSRNGLAYAQLQKDLNGNFFLFNRDPGDELLHSEYMEVIFRLMTPSLAGDVYIVGRFNNWLSNAQSSMQYDSTEQSYLTKLKLRQGYYEYRYIVTSNTVDQDILEGNHFQTENNYEVFVYYRNPINNFDELVGYQAISTDF